MSRIDLQIAQAQKRVRELKEKKAAELAAKKARRKPLRKGRPPTCQKRLKQIELEAYLKPLADVALKFDVGLRTLYKYGITRKNLDKKAADAALA